jgi:hypothetical protein
MSHVFGDEGVVDEQVARLARLIDAGFVTECGWDVAGQVLAPPSDHPQLGWQEPVGEVSCAAGCAVPGCRRSAGSQGLCRSHRRGQLLRGLSVEEFTAAPTRQALARFGICQVAACPRDRCGGQLAYCEPHQARWLRERGAESGQRTLDVTRRYYRVEEARRRAAIDTVTALSFDRHGNRIWRDAQALLDSEHARYAIGEVAVPYGRCAEPSNVQAGGGACPVRFRCAGCDPFRTDAAFLPDLTGYLDDLLRTRERLSAALHGVDEWARADATPTEEEITRIRRLINRIRGDIAGLDPTERTEIHDAVAVVRPHRAAHTVTLGMPTIAPAAPLTTTTAQATT